MTLLENAQDSIIESLRAVQRAGEEPRAWKPAIRDIVQAIELLLKERLLREHPLLIYENVDTRKRTVTLDQALTRLGAAAGIDLTERDRAAIYKAKTWRDRITHYEFEFSLQEVETAYVTLFEWATGFHVDHLDVELHEVIDQDLWATEAQLMEYFNNEMVVYNGVPIHRSWPAEIVDAQNFPALVLDQVRFPRLPYGSSGSDWDTEMTPDRRCHDCAVAPGQYHAFGCDWERCPRCLGQLLSCECWSDDLDAVLSA